MNELHYGHNTGGHRYKFTYKGSHIDVDTSCEKVVDLSHQTIITCLKQLYFLKQKVGVQERVGGSSHVCNGGQSTWYSLWRIHGPIQSELTVISRSGM